jgi:sugar/nucleoside kinase (ribokinase family)
MTVDVVCVGPPFLDVIFRGLPVMPTAGEEVLASDVVIVPGAMANVAFALRQLGLEAVVCAPVGTDAAGRFLQELMAEAGIPWIGDPSAATPVSVGLPLDGDRAFVTVMPSAAIDMRAVAALAPRAIVVNVPLPDGMPVGPRVFGVLGDPQVDLLRERPDEPLSSLRALVVNEREARNLTGLTDAVEAGRQIAGRGCPVIVTRGEHGAVAVAPDGDVVEAAAAPATATDTVGAGDLFTAAFVFADLAGRSMEECLATATAYASHSLARPATRQKGLTRAAFSDAIASTTGPEAWMLEVRG